MAQDRGREERRGQSDPANEGSNRGLPLTQGSGGLNSASEVFWKMSCSGAPAGGL